MNFLKSANFSFFAIGISGIFTSFFPVQAASMTGDTLSFTLGDNDNIGRDPVELNVTLEDLGNDIQFKANVLRETNTGNIADLRRIILDIADESLLSGLSVSGSDITGSKFEANAVGFNRISPKFDMNFAFGTSGTIGSDDIRSTMFTLSHISEDLSLDLFAEQRFGARLTSTGVTEHDRHGNSKILAHTPNIIISEENDTTEIPEPGTAIAIGLFTIGSLITTRKRRF